jgi:hypothetical protein
MIASAGLALTACASGGAHPSTAPTATATATATTNANTNVGFRYVNRANAQRLIEQRIDAQRHQRVVVSCPRNVPLDVNHRFVCRARAPGGLNALLVVTVLNKQGRLHFQPATTH